MMICHQGEIMMKSFCASSEEYFFRLHGNISISVMLNAGFDTTELLE